MSKERYLTAKAAAEKLGVSLSTLYAYVSRGLVRSEAAGDGTRQRRYAAEDIERLLARKAARRNPEKLAHTALHWGAPVMDSSITLIEHNTLFYRGQDATLLAANHTLEEVAALLWTGDMANANPLFQESPPSQTNRYETMLLHVELDGANLTTVRTFQVCLALAAADDLAAYDLRPAAIAATGARIMRLLAMVTTGEVPNNIGLAAMLHQGWCADKPEGERVLNTALILCADHELNASSFTARVVASAQATPYEAVIAGLSTLQGAKHGGYTERVAVFLEQIASSNDIPAAMAARLRQGETIPGFGHPLYPNGDPRARCLLNLLAEIYPNLPALNLAHQVEQSAANLIGETPNIDFALAVMARALGLKPDEALGVFALGRTVGWIGHAIEQYQEDRLIRPRARYTGKQPDAK